MSSPLNTATDFLKISLEQGGSGVFEKSEQDELVEGGLIASLKKLVRITYFLILYNE